MASAVRAFRPLMVTLASARNVIGVPGVPLSGESQPVTNPA